MDRFLRGFITVEKTLQIVALVGVILLLGYVGLTSFQQEQTSPASSISPTTQN